jgi:thiol-disulfide isomerase/thioredoxin
VKKNSTLLLFVCCLHSWAIGQTNLTTAELTYIATTTFTNQSDRQVTRTAKHVLSLSNDFLKTIQYPNKNLVFVYLHDLNKRQTMVYLNNGEKYYQTTENYAPTVFNLGKYNVQKPTVQLLNDTSTIGNYACKKAVLNFTIEGESDTMEVWYCPNIQLTATHVNYIFKDLPGIPVRFDFKSRPELTFGQPNKNIHCRYLLQSLNSQPERNDVVENSERYVVVDESKKGDVIFELMAAKPKSNVNKGIAITDTIQRKDGLSVTLTKYTPFAVGDTVATFEGIDINDKKVSDKSYPEKLLVLNFWFTGCAPCIKEMPYLNKVREAYKGKDVAFVSITYNNKKEVETFLAKRAFAFDKVIDAQHLIDQFRVSTYPLTIIIDQNRVVRFVQVGELKGGLEKAIDQLLR